MDGRLGCSTDGEGEVDDSNSRIHLREEERKPATRERGREEF